MKVFHLTEDGIIIQLILTRFNSHCNSVILSSEKSLFSLVELSPDELVFGGKYKIICSGGKFRCGLCGSVRNSRSAICLHIRRFHALQPIPPQDFVVEEVTVVTSDLVENSTVDGGDNCGVVANNAVDVEAQANDSEHTVDSEIQNTSGKELLTFVDILQW